MCTLAARVRPRSVLAVETYKLAHVVVVSTRAWGCRWDYHAAGAGGVLELRAEAAEAERLLDAALRLDPANPLAHHLRIHLTEATRPLPCVPPPPAALLLRPVSSGLLLLLVCASAVNFAVGLAYTCVQHWPVGDAVRAISTAASLAKLFLCRLIHEMRCCVAPSPSCLASQGARFERDRGSDFGGRDDAPGGPLAAPPGPLAAYAGAHVRQARPCTPPVPLPRAHTMATCKRCVSALALLRRRGTQQREEQPQRAGNGAAAWCGGSAPGAGR